jgi:hypothetical protein
MSVLIDKVVAIHNIGLPYDIAEEINGYCFHDHVQVSARKAKKIVNWKIDTSLNGWWGNNGQWWFSGGFFHSIPAEHDDWPTGTYTERQFQCSFCIKCGNYIGEYLPYDYAPPAIICTCNNHQMQLQVIEEPEQHAQQDPDDLYWIETESELDPIETAYAQWRDDYYYNN